MRRNSKKGQNHRQAKERVKTLSCQACQTSGLDDPGKWGSEMGAPNVEGDMSLDRWTKADTAAARGRECGESRIPRQSPYVRKFVANNPSNRDCRKELTSFPLSTAALAPLIYFFRVVSVAFAPWAFSPWA